MKNTENCSTGSRTKKGEKAHAYDVIDAKIRKDLTIEDAKEELSKNNIGTSLFKEVYSVIKAVDGARAPSAEELLVSAVKLGYVLFLENTLNQSGKILITDLQGLCRLADSRVWTAFKYIGDTCPITRRGFRIFEVEYYYGNHSKCTRFFTKEHYWQCSIARRKSSALKATLLLVPHALPYE